MGTTQFTLKTIHYDFHIVSNTHYTSHNTQSTKYSVQPTTYTVQRTIYNRLADCIRALCCVLCISGYTHLLVTRFHKHRVERKHLEESVINNCSQPPHGFLKHKSNMRPMPHVKKAVRPYDFKTCT